MNQAYDRSTQNGFHPPRGNKSGMEATGYHELGHALTQRAGEKLGYGQWGVDRAASTIVNTAAKNAGYHPWKRQDFRAKISGYAAKNPAEAVAEAFSDFKCNGAKAAKESREIVKVLNGILK